ncbi:MAG: hypothetical protein ACJAV4_000762 [Pontimonas sp.]|jgi:hypothetical protein
MVRWIVIGAVGAIAFTIYALVDLFMTNAPKIRAFPKPLWIAVIVLLPVIGPLLWLLIGKSPPREARGGVTRKAPDDDASFLGGLDLESSTERINRLEEELRALDDEDSGTAEGDATDQDSKPPSA